MSMNRLDDLDAGGWSRGAITRNEDRDQCGTMIPLGPQPEGFYIVNTSNFTRYTDWMEKASRDAECSRFLRQLGWHQPLNAAPPEDFNRLIMVSEKSMIDLAFDRSPISEIGVGPYLGEESGR
jgi:hypothetical protein